VAKAYPDRFICNGSFDPRDGELALDYIHYMKETFDIQGVKLYTAEWKGDSRGWKLNDPNAYRFAKNSGSRTSMSIKDRPSFPCPRTRSTCTTSIMPRPTSKA